MDPLVAAEARALVRDVPGFPKPGVLFKDITPLLANPRTLRAVINELASPFADLAITHVVGIESRGFLFGVPVALALGVAFVPARKDGKLPRRTVREPYALEYGDDALCVHDDALSTGGRVLVVDDVLATGGTAAAACRLVERLGGEVVAVVTLVEILPLAGRQHLSGRRVESLLAY